MKTCDTSDINILPVGDTGSAGSTGATGATGLDGADGATGSRGIRGGSRTEVMFANGLDVVTNTTSGGLVSGTSETHFLGYFIYDGSTIEQSINYVKILVDNNRSGKCDFRLFLRDVTANLPILTISINLPSGKSIQTINPSQLSNIPTVRSVIRISGVVTSISGDIDSGEETDVVLHSITIK